MTARSPAPGAGGRSEFERRCRSAEHGTLLPRIADLLRGCPFLCNDIKTDATTYAEGQSNRLVPLDGTAHLLAALTAMLAEPGRRAFVDVASPFEAAAHAAAARLKRTGSVRLHLYAALSGNQVPVTNVAAYAVELADAAGFMPELAREHAAAASTWLLTATGKAELLRTWTRRSARVFMRRANEVAEYGVVERMLLSRRELLDTRPGCPVSC